MVEQQIETPKLFINTDGKIYHTKEYIGKPIPITMSKDQLAIGCTLIEARVLIKLYEEYVENFISNKPISVKVQ